MIAVDPEARTADVQGMTTYEHLVDATLPHGLMPAASCRSCGRSPSAARSPASASSRLVPQRPAARVGARDGHPHRRRRGRHATARRRARDLFDAFPNSYGSLGYATRLRDRARAGRALRRACATSASTTPSLLAKTDRDDRRDAASTTATRSTSSTASRSQPGESYLTLGRVVRRPGVGALQASDYTGQQIYYRSIQQRETRPPDHHDYLWRWDTDWFWCSRRVRRAEPARAPGLAAPLAAQRRLPPLVGLDHRFRVDRPARPAHAAGPQRERVVQDVEIPVERTAEFLDWFDAEVGMRPVWLCPLRLREPERSLADRTRSRPGTTYVNVGFWGTVPIAPGRADGDRNRAIEAKVHRARRPQVAVLRRVLRPRDVRQLYDGADLTSRSRSGTTPTTG